MTQPYNTPSIASYLPINISTGTSEVNAINYSSLEEALSFASDDDQVVYIHDNAFRLILTLNAVGQPNETLSTIEQLILQYAQDAEGDDVK